MKHKTLIANRFNPSAGEKVPFIPGPDYVIPTQSYVFFRDIFVYEDMIMQSASFLKFRNPDIVNASATEELEKCVQVFLANPTIPGEVGGICQSY